MKAQSRNAAGMLGTLATVSVVLIACASDARVQVDTGTQSAPPAAVVAPPSDVPARGGVIFDPSAIRPREMVGTMIVDSINATQAMADSAWIGRADFSGELTLTGHTVKHFDSSARAVCFEADSSSAERMPRWQGDTRRAWFCFGNNAEAQRLLAAPGEERAATIVIDRFTIHRNFSDAVNEARLARVIQR